MRIEPNGPNSWKSWTTIISLLEFYSRLYYHLYRYLCYCWYYRSYHHLYYFSYYLTVRITLQFVLPFVLPFVLSSNNAGAIMVCGNAIPLHTLGEDRYNV